MFCPRCGQQLLSDARFCSRCGLPLHVISDVVANNGFPLSEPGGIKRRSPRKQGMRIGGMIMFTGLALAPIFFALCFFAKNGDPLFVPSAIFFVGLCWLLFAFIFADDTVSSSIENKLDQYRNVSPPSFTLLPDRLPA